MQAVTLLASDVVVDGSKGFLKRGGELILVQLARAADVVGFVESRKSVWRGAKVPPVVEALGGGPPGADGGAPAAGGGGAAGALAGGDGGGGAVPVDDIRILWEVHEAQGESFKEWRTVVSESYSHLCKDNPLGGPASALTLMKQFHRHGGSPRGWLQLWLRDKRIDSSARVAHEVGFLVDLSTTVIVTPSSTSHH